ncbi:ribosomal RNA small subunit methyltransferase I [Lentilactobacillus fungorum]|uniref:Ribosomal RNA small subunit methyltransferase I n=1 Tax=Lentilactobacillus fungorum TaxID=2201250 RepID=A0ABQ3W1W4_9LACO|nr:16S rRNA (cytidine(1402)-2'-O)-methyltransferase [Lentilactobacillus fungorum]GHP15187.1 ribosomal RNA small subunit methyltransferase I [Lentilactobacillus fungorum]
METQKSFDATTQYGTLYLVPTPIGNLADMTYRAVEILKTVDLIAAEDTRNTQKLLNHFGVETKQISFHEHNTAQRIPELVAKLKQGVSIAQVSDAGMPSISDPGHELVVACIHQSIKVVPLPGANAGITALIASGILPQPFYFYGFLSRKPKEQREELGHLQNRPETLIFYEAPHRLKKTLKELIEQFGPDRQVALCRELTKKHEEFIRGDLAAVFEWANSVEIRGEFVIIVAGNHNPKSDGQDPLAGMTMSQQVDFHIKNGLKVNEAIKRVAKDHHLRKQVVYNEYHDIK